MPQESFIAEERFTATSGVVATVEIELPQRQFALLAVNVNKAIPASAPVRVNVSLRIRGQDAVLIPSVFVRGFGSASVGDVAIWVGELRVNPRTSRIRVTHDNNSGSDQVLRVAALIQ